MKHPILKTVLISLIAVVLVLLGFHYYCLDGISGWLLSRFYDEDTPYAPGYSDSAFRKVREGMTEDEVRDLLGQPLDRWSLDNNRFGRRWSKSPSDGNYKLRVVIFTEGKVTRKTSEFYLD